MVQNSENPENLDLFHTHDRLKVVQAEWTVDEPCISTKFKHSFLFIFLFFKLFIKWNLGWAWSLVIFSYIYFYFLHICKQLLLHVTKDLSVLHGGLNFKERW